MGERFRLGEKKVERSSSSATRANAPEEKEQQKEAAKHRRRIASEAVAAASFANCIADVVGIARSPCGGPAAFACDAREIAHTEVAIGAVLGRITRCRAESDATAKCALEACVTVAIIGTSGPTHSHTLAVLALLPCRTATCTCPARGTAAVNALPTHTALAICRAASRDALAILAGLAIGALAFAGVCGRAALALLEVT